MPKVHAVIDSISTALSEPSWSRDLRHHAADLLATSGQLDKTVGHGLMPEALMSQARSCATRLEGLDDPRLIPGAQLTYRIDQAQEQGFGWRDVMERSVTADTNALDLWNAALWSAGRWLFVAPKERCSIGDPRTWPTPMTAKPWERWFVGVGSESQLSWTLGCVQPRLSQARPLVQSIVVHIATGGAVKQQLLFGSDPRETLLRSIFVTVQESGSFVQRQLSLNMAMYESHLRVCLSQEGATAQIQWAELIGAMAYNKHHVLIDARAPSNKATILGRSLVREGAQHERQTSFPRAADHGWTDQCSDVDELALASPPRLSTSSQKRPASDAPPTTDELIRFLRPGSRGLSQDHQIDFEGLAQALLDDVIN